MWFTAFSVKGNDNQRWLYFLMKKEKIMADTNVNKVSMTEKQKVKEITDRLEEGLKELFESKKYKSYLITMSKFHNYSFNNTL